MSDPRVEKLAQIIVDYSTAIQRGELVEITATSLSAPLVEAIYKLVLLRGAHPYTNVKLPGLEELFFAHASDDQLRHVSLVDQLLVDRSQVHVYIMSAQNTKALSKVDPAKQVARNVAHRELSQEFSRKCDSGEIRRCAALYPTYGYAQDAEMSLREFEDLVYGACLVDEDDPMAAWDAVNRRQRRIVDFLATKQTVRVVAPETDLTMSVAGRRFINCDGKVNLPDGEVFTSPVEDSVHGHITFTYPLTTRGREVEDVRLWFDGGRVVKATASKNEDFLNKMLDTDEGSRRLGEFAFGTNTRMTRFTRNGHLDEKIAGTIHLALGNSFPKAGGRNRSAIHWDMVCDLRHGGEVYADRELFYKDGEFLDDM